MRVHEWFFPSLGTRLPSETHNLPRSTPVVVLGLAYRLFPRQAQHRDC
mgnify:CR=1 FL=1